MCNGPHLTQTCLAAQQRAHKRPRPEADWILPQHEQLLDILEQPGIITGADRDFVLEGVINGCYSEDVTFTAASKVEVREKGKLYIDGQQIHHGSLWTVKSLNTRHREHLTNCVRDSQAWQEKAVDISLDIVVEEIVRQFGERHGKGPYYRLHHPTSSKPTSVKVFKLDGGKTCAHCLHCDAYEFLNRVLSCEAQHGPRLGWASELMASRIANQMS